jgi:hypothetical protein
MITMGSPYFVWINTNEIISSWYLLDAVCVTPSRTSRAQVARLRSQSKTAYYVGDALHQTIQFGRPEETRAVLSPRPTPLRFVYGIPMSDG